MKDYAKKTVLQSTPELLNELNPDTLKVEVSANKEEIGLSHFDKPITLDTYSAGDKEVSNAHTDGYFSKPMGYKFKATITDGSLNLEDSRIAILFRSPKHTDFRRFFPEDWDKKSNVINFEKYMLIKVERLLKAEAPGYAVKIPGTDSEDGKTAMYQTVDIPVYKYLPIPDCVLEQYVLEDKDEPHYKRLKKQLDFAIENIDVITAMLEELIAFEIKNKDVKIKNRTCSYFKNLKTANRLDITLKTPETDS